MKNRYNVEHPADKTSNQNARQLALSYILTDNICQWVRLVEYRIQAAENAKVSRRAVRGIGEGLTKSAITSNAPSGGLTPKERITKAATTSLPPMAPTSIAITTDILHPIEHRRSDARSIISPHKTPYPAEINNTDQPSNPTAHPATAPHITATIIVARLVDGEATPRRASLGGFCGKFASFSRGFM